MKSNLEAHANEVISAEDTRWINLQEKAPEPGRIFRLRIPYESREIVPANKTMKPPMLICFATDSGDIYTFNFSIGEYYPLQMVKEELAKKRLMTFYDDAAVYAYLKDGLVKSIPGHLKIISEMEAILKDERHKSG